MKDYTKYFKTKLRTDGTEFIALANDTPDELIKFIRTAHQDFSMTPCSWIYGVIVRALGELLLDELEDIYIDADVRTRDFISWLQLPYALRMCEEAKTEGLIDCHTSLEERIRMGQWLAMKRIYQMTDAFLNPDRSR